MIYEPDPGEGIVLPFRNLWAAKRCDPATLPEVDTFGPEDQAYYDEKGWADYRPEYHKERLLPSLGEPRYFSSRCSRLVLPIAGRRYRVAVRDDGRHEQHEHEGKSLVLRETDDPETTPDCAPPAKYRWGRHYVQAFGQPRWIQNAHYPAGDDGRPCSHFLSVENGWGDMGNWNILVSLGPDGVPCEAYFEASCH